MPVNCMGLSRILTVQAICAPSCPTPPLKGPHNVQLMHHIIIIIDRMIIY